jgi:hypothetical protein
MPVIHGCTGVPCESYIGWVDPYLCEIVLGILKILATGLPGENQQAEEKKNEWYVLHS